MSSFLPPISSGVTLTPVSLPLTLEIPQLVRSLSLDDSPRHHEDLPITLISWLNLVRYHGNNGGEESQEIFRTQLLPTYPLNAAQAVDLPQEVKASIEKIKTFVLEKLKNPASQNSDSISREALIALNLLKHHYPHLLSREGTPHRHIRGRELDSPSDFSSRSASVAGRATTPSASPKF